MLLIFVIVFYLVGWTEFGTGLVLEEVRKGKGREGKERRGEGIAVNFFLFEQILVFSLVLVLVFADEFVSLIS
jgi:hypothetical protein